MLPRLPLSLAVSLLTFALVACDGSSPTESQSIGRLVGIWEGELAAYPSNEDWSLVRLSLVTAGTTVTGTLTSRNGVVHPVTSRNDAGTTVLEIHDLPQAAPCSVALIVERVSFTTMEGRLSGRCANTLLSDFRLSRPR